jgi:DNA invertase Pin-like site-specific DNA recombinase
MRQAVIYLRVSTIEQTTANQERELREVASRMGCEIVKVYRDHGISGAKGRDKRPAFDKLCRDAARREFDMVMAWSVDRLGRSLQDLVGFLSELHALKIDLFLRHDACRQGDVSDDGRVCRVRACHDSGTRPRRACEGQERGEASWSASDRPCAGEANP